jgi:hypothetical protein
MAPLQKEPDCDYCTENGLKCEKLGNECKNCQNMNLICAYDMETRTRQMEAKIEFQLVKLQNIAVYQSSKPIKNNQAKLNPQRLVWDFPMSDFDYSQDNFTSPNPLILETFLESYLPLMCCLNFPELKAEIRKWYYECWFLFNCIACVTIPYINLKPGQQRNAYLGLKCYRQAQMAFNSEILECTFSETLGLVLLCRASCGMFY